jgi:hypothetical protein
MQNKPNFKMGNINISAGRTKAYANEQRTMNNEHYPKQSQIKANFKRSKPISNAGTPYSACRRRDCHGNLLLIICRR